MELSPKIPAKGMGGLGRKKLNGQSSAHISKRKPIVDGRRLDDSVQFPP